MARESWMLGYARLDEMLEPVEEAPGVELLGVAANHLGVELVVAEASHRTGKRIGCLLVEEQAGDALDDCVTRAALSIGNNRATAGVRLDWRQSEVLFAGKYQRATAHQLGAHLLIG